MMSSRSGANGYAKHYEFWCLPWSVTAAEEGSRGMLCWPIAIANGSQPVHFERCADVGGQHGVGAGDAYGIGGAG
jgi:hypothetical protein